MAEYLASIFGTEKDKVNCSFYFKIGACRHGERCSRIHNKPTFSQTIVLQNLYINPQNSAKSADGSHLANVSDEEMQVSLPSRSDASLLCTWQDLPSDRCLLKNIQKDRSLVFEGAISRLHEK